MRLQPNPGVVSINGDINAKRLTDVLREVAAQINATSEGQLAGATNAQTAAPTTGTYTAGDFIRNSAPSGATPIYGWICTASGTPGTWVALQGGGGGSGITALTGDVTASGSGSVTATIAADAVTYAKMQNVSAASKLLGRGASGGSGDPQEITLGPSLTMSGTTLDASFSALPVLNYLTNQVNCYGLRLLNIGYPGPLIKVKHLTLLTFLDVYPVAGSIDLDWAAITTFAAGGNVGVTTWYDQTRNGDLTQATDANMPLIAVAGALVSYPGTVAGRYAMKVNGGTQALTSSAATIAQDFSRIGVLQFLSVASGKDIFTDASANSLNFSASGTLASFAGANVTLKSGVVANDLAIVQETFYNAFGSRNVYNGTRATYSPGASGSFNRGVGGAAAGTFLLAEYLHFNRAISTFEDSVIQSNLKAYWGTP